MKIIFAFDKFKGSLTSKQAADCALDAAREVFDEVDAVDAVIIPTADGGEGTVEAFLASCEGTRVECNVTPPHVSPSSDERIAAQFALLSDGRCVMEMSAASGLGLVPPERRNPLHTSTYGTGEMIRAALELGADRILLGLGGSATNDGGCGMAAALGARFYDHDGVQIPCPTGEDLIRIGSIDLTGMDARLKTCEITACCDVDNPLYGEHGAAVVYAPQKGAREEDIPTLDVGLANLSAILWRDHGIDIRETPGAGAAGGMGGGVIAFLGGALNSGIDAVLDAADLEKHLSDAELVLTGEGKIDEQTLRGKVIMGVLRRARRVGVPVFIFGGTVIDPTELYRQGASSVLSICTGPQSLEEAMEYAEADLYDCVFAALRIYYDGHYAMIRNALRRQYADKLGGMFDDIAEKAGL